MLVPIALNTVIKVNVNTTKSLRVTNIPLIILYTLALFSGVTLTPVFQAPGMHSTRDIIPYVNQANIGRTIIYFLLPKLSASPYKLKCVAISEGLLYNSY